MTKATALMTTLRRFSTSTSETFRRSSKADITSQMDPAMASRDQESNVTRRFSGVSLLTLPVELLAQVLEQVAFVDLCAIRLLCKDAERQISEGDILRHWISRNLDKQLVSLYTPPVPPTFAYVVSAQRRLRQASHLAKAYIEYIEWEVVRHSLVRRHPYLHDLQLHEDFKPVATKIREKLVKLLLTVQHYLESCMHIMLELCETESPHHSLTFREQYTARERKILDQYEPKHLPHVYQFWLFLSWVNNQMLNRPTYAGTFERAIRGWMVDPVRGQDFQVMLLIGNLRGLTELMRLRTFKDRRKLVETWIKQLDPESNIQWQQHWSKFSPQYGVSPTKEQAMGALNVKLQNGEVLANSARSALIRNGVLGTDADLDIGTSDQCTDFLCNVAGYNVLRTLPFRRPQAESAEEQSTAA